MAAFASVDAYLAAQPQPARRILTRVRNVIRGVLPGAEQSISYGIPTFKVNGKPVVYFSGWKAHFALYPASDAVMAELGTELAPHLDGKGTLRFDYDESVPVHLIGAVAAARLREVSAPPAKKAASRAPKKRAKKRPKKRATRR